MSSSSVVLRRGAASFEVALDADVVAPLVPPAARDAVAILDEALAAPVSGAPLAELARGARRVAVLVPGIDRVAGAGACVRAVARALAAAGVPAGGVTLALATGTHAHRGRADVEALVGADVAAGFAVRIHDPGAGDLREVGVTGRGTRVLLPEAVLDADLRVLVGRLVPHYFAGWGGGRKALVPGVAGRATIVANHRLTLAPARGIDKGVSPGNLDGNPVHLDMLEAARMAGPSFALGTVLDDRDRVALAVAGAMEAAHAEGCARARPWLVRQVPAPFAAAITCGGGDPYDLNFMQALKAAFNVEAALAPGAPLLWIAGAGGGMQRGFLRWAAIEDDAALDAAVRADYDLAGHNSIWLRGLLRRRRVALWSELPAAEVGALGIAPVASLDEGLAWLRARMPPGGRLGVFPSATVMCAASAPGVA